MTVSLSNWQSTTWWHQWFAQGLYTATTVSEETWTSKHRSKPTGQWIIDKYLELYSFWLKTALRKVQGRKALHYIVDIAMLSTCIEFALKEKNMMNSNWPLPLFSPLSHNITETLRDAVQLKHKHGFSTERLQLPGNIRALNVTVKSSFISKTKVPGDNW